MHERSRPGRRQPAAQYLTVQGQTVARIVYGFVLAALIALVYSPSLKHLPRADDWWYYLNTLETHTFVDTFLASHSYARTRTVMPGDESFYRPIHFAFLAYKKDAIGPYFAIHQAIPLVLHWIFCFIAMVLLDHVWRRVQTLRESTWSRKIPRALVYAIPAFIAVNVALVDAVIWTHITPYLIFYVLTLATILLTFRGSDPQRQAPWWLGFTVVLMLLVSAFTYEYGQFYAIVLAPTALTWNCDLRVRVAVTTAILCIPIVYQAANAIDKTFHSETVEDVEDMNFYADSVVQSFSPTTIRSVYRFARYAGGVPFFASTVPINEKEERILIQELSVRRALKESGFARMGLLALPVWIALSGFGYWAGIRARRLMVPALAGILLGLFGLYALGISLVRLNPDADLELILAGSSYYMYWPFTLLLVVLAGGLFLFIEEERHRIAGLAGTVLAGLLVIYFGLEGTASAVRLTGFNQTIADQQAYSRAIVHDVNRMLTAYPGATFCFDLANSIAIPDTWDIGVPLTTLLYRARENNFAPDYFIRIERDATFATPHESQAAPPSHPLVPHLIGVGRDVNVYLYDGRYYGLLRFEGRYAPESEASYLYLAEGDSVEEVLAQSADLVMRRKRDVEAGILRDRYWH